MRSCAAYGAENATTLTGRPGSVSSKTRSASTWAPFAKRSPRLMMEVGFGVSPPSPVDASTENP